MIGIAFIFTFSIISTMSEKKIPNVSDYFENLKGDMTKLTWAHAVNNQSLLAKSLEDADVMMLEADVVLGVVVGTNDVKPIMAHPPKNESDLSLEQFLDRVIKAQSTVKKGVKLDFKSSDAFVRSVDVVNSVRNELTFPVWLNADVLKGPIESDTIPVDADKFLRLSVDKFPSCTLSLGWTTKYGPNMTGRYTDQQFNNMKRVLEEHKVFQPVTLAVRAGIIAETCQQVLTLIENINSFQKSNKTSLTIWMSTDTDPVDIPKLKSLILTVGKSRIFLDVPQFILAQLDLDN